MLLEWVLTNRMFALLYMQMFPIAWKIITRKPAVPEGMVKYPMLYYYMMKRNCMNLDEMAAIRFPSQEEIRKVYQAVANYLQIPAGTGAGQYYDFDIADFIKKFKLDSNTTIYIH